VATNAGETMNGSAAGVGVATNAGETMNAGAATNAGAAGFYSGMFGNAAKSEECHGGACVGNVQCPCFEWLRFRRRPASVGWKEFEFVHG
jgi:hypothetical protein